MKSPLNDSEALQKTIEMFKSKLNANHDIQKQLKSQLNQLQQEHNDLTDKLETLLKYQDFTKIKGFAAIKQYMDTHTEEIKAAEQERIAKEEQERDEAERADFSFEGDPEAFTGFSSTG